MHRLIHSPLARRARAARALVLGALVCGTLAALGCGGSTESRIAEARALQDVGDFSSSIELLREVLAKDPENGEANYRLGLALVQTRQPTLAIWPLRKAADAEQYRGLGGLLLASTLLQTEGYEDAIVAADEVLEIDPRNVGALIVRMQASMQLGKPEDALLASEQVLEVDPQHFHALVTRAAALQKLERADEAEQAWKDLARISSEGDDPALAARGCLSLAQYYQSIESDEVEAAVKRCFESYPHDPLVLTATSKYYEDNGRPEEATKVWRGAIEEAPDDYSLRSKLASRLSQQGDNEAAEAVLVEAAELFDDAEAWSTLARFHQNQGDAAKALEATNRALERVPATANPVQLQFRKGDLLVQLGELEAAEQIVEQLDEEVYQELLRGRILLARGEKEQALDAIEAGLVLWPNNAMARYLAGSVADDLGQRAKAIAHFREAVRTDPKATDASLALAKIQLEEGEYEDAAAMARKQAQERPFAGPEAFIIGARAAVALERYDEGRKTLDNLAKTEGQERTVLVERVALEQAAGRPEVAMQLIEASGFDLADPENELILRQLADSLAQAGRYDEALAQIDAALTQRPQSASLHDTRGRVLVAADRTDEARAEFERAIAADPDLAAAHQSMAGLALADGNLDLALEHAERAAELDPQDANSAYLSARILISQGRADEGIARLREVVEEHPDQAGAANDLAWYLAEKGVDLDRALSLAQRAVRLDRRSETLDTLGWVQLQRGDAGAAATSFERALELDSTASSVRYRLGLALQALGRSEQALTAFREAVGTGPFPEAEAARAEIARLESVDRRTP